MDALLLENLGRYQRELEAARDRVRRQVEACIEVGYRSKEIARVLGCRPNNVRAMPVWRARKQETRP